jgi:DNA invertase Pin-like site-specific DNA recombinase
MQLATSYVYDDGWQKWGPSLESRTSEARKKGRKEGRKEGRKKEGKKEKKQVCCSRAQKSFDKNVQELVKYRLIISVYSNFDVTNNQMVVFNVVSGAVKIWPNNASIETA